MGVVGGEKRPFKVKEAYDDDLMMVIGVLNAKDRVCVPAMT